MKLKGVMEFSLGGFLTFRGYAKLGEIARISRVDENYQRKKIDSHLDGINKFLEKGANLFFPEVILGCYLPENDEELERLEAFYEAFRNDEKGNFSFKKLNIGIQQSKPYGDITFKVATLSTSTQKSDENIFYRIDGNHRISAVENGSDKVKDIITPFSIIFFRTEEEYKKQSKMVFHNTNFKHIPLSMEHNLKLIFEDNENFSDEFLKNDPSFGPHYCYAKYIKYDDIDKYFPNISKSLQTNPRKTFLNLFKALCSKQECRNISKEQVEATLSRVNENYNNDMLKDSENGNIVSAFIYYILSTEEKSNDRKLKFFKKWILKNHIYNAKNLELKSLIEIFDEIYNSRIKNIFVAMPFDKKFDNVWNSIVRVYNQLIKDGCKLSTEYKNAGEYMPYRVDKPIEESKDIIQKIIKGIDKCDLFIANLTQLNLNVLYEVGLAEGKNKPLILFCDYEAKEKIPFDLKTKSITFYNSSDFNEFESKLSKAIINIIKTLKY